MVSPLVRPSDWSYPREFGKRESERFAAGSRHNEPRCMRGRIYTPGALYVARAGTATKRDAPLMMKVEPADFIAFRPPPSLSRHSIPLGIFNTRCFSIFSLLPFETLSSTRCCSRTLEFSRAEKERERGRGRGKKAETRRGNVYKYIYIYGRRAVCKTNSSNVGGRGGGTACTRCRVSKGKTTIAARTPIISY